MNELTSLGVILLLALLAGHLVKFLRIPEVTGYILAGVALGPSVLGWVSSENLAALEVLSEVALGLILFSIGSVFEFARFSIVGRADRSDHLGGIGSGGVSSQRFACWRPGNRGKWPAYWARWRSRPPRPQR